jgi:prepilin-type N-terminal cleavage/methylation domain-containing protein
MFKSHTNSNSQNRAGRARSGFDISPLEFGFVSGFELRISSFRRRRRGFSFTEIMFAVVILGIGFIMVAAIFPVALQQAKATSDEVNATTIARSATNQFSQFLHDGNDPLNTSNCKPITNSASIALVQQLSTVDNLTLTPPAVSLWTSLSGNMILSQDPRFAWAALYRRGATNATQPGTWVPYVQLFVFPLQVRNRTIFTNEDVKLFSGPPYWNSTPTANLMPHPVRVMIANDVPDAGGADLIAFDTSGNDEEAFNVAAGAEGAYVVIDNDNISSPAADKGLMNGRIFRVGVRRSDLDGLSNMTDAFGNSLFPITTTEVYELAPGNEFTPDPGANGKFNDSDDILDIGISVPGAAQATPAHAFVIGRGYADPNNPSSGFEGDSMPISAFTTYLRVQ